MKTIELASQEYWSSSGLGEDIDHNDFTQIFSAGVEFAQKWIPIEEELPEYYTPAIGVFIMGESEYPMSVWRAWSEVSNGDIYTILGTDVVAYGEPIKWRPIERKTRWQEMTEGIIFK